MAIIKILPSVKKYDDLGKKITFNKLSIKGEITDFQSDLLKEFTDSLSINVLEFKCDLNVSNGQSKLSLPFM